MRRLRDVMRGSRTCSHQKTREFVGDYFFSVIWKTKWVKPNVTNGVCSDFSSTDLYSNRIKKSLQRISSLFHPRLVLFHPRPVLSPACSTHGLFCLQLVPPQLVPPTACSDPPLFRLFLFCSSLGLSQYVLSQHVLSAACCASGFCSAFR